MRLLDLLAEGPQEREETVDGFTIRGRPDANVFGRSVLLDPAARSVRARHWSGLIGCAFEPSLVPRVLLVRECLVNPDDPAGHDELEVAQLACSHGPLFLRLFAASCRVCGLASPQSAVVEAASPN